MKKLLVTATAVLACAGAFSQGKISFQNDSLRLVYFDPSLPGIGGHTPINGGSNQPPLMADLYYGTSSSSLSLLTSSTFSAIAPGKWNAVNNTIPGVAGGGVIFVIAQVRDSGTAPSPTLTSGDAGTSPTSSLYTNLTAGKYWGTSLEFQFTLGSSPLSFPAMWSASGTWLPGTFDLSGVDGNLNGSRGAILVTSLIPEPTSFALAGLGAAALMIFRRRK